MEEQSKVLNTISDNLKSFRDKSYADYLNANAAIGALVAVESVFGSNLTFLHVNEIGRLLANAAASGMLSKEK